MTLFALIKVEIESYDTDMIVDALQVVARGIAAQDYTSGPVSHGGVDYTIIVRQAHEEIGS